MDMAGGRPNPLVGRDAELDRLLAEVADLHSGRRSVMALEGPPGIGKTRLIDELVERCGDSQNLILRATCIPSDAPPHLPFVSIMRQLAREWPASAAMATAAVEALTGDTSPLDTVSDEASRWLSSKAAASSEQLQARLFLKVAEVFESVLHQCSMVLIIEDAQWLDGPSTALLEFVASELIQRRGRCGILIAVVTRPSELGTEQWHVGSLASRTSYSRLRLEPLSETACIEAALAYGLKHPSGEILRRLVRLSGGNPLYIREAVAQLESGAEGVDADLAHVRSDRLTALIEQRLKALPSTTRAVLAHAALLPQPFSVPEVDAAVGSTRDHVAEQLRTAIEREVLTESDRGLMFTHGIWRERCRKLLLLDEQKQINDRIAQHLIGPSTPDAVRTMQISRHLLDGTRSDRSLIVEYCRQAGDLHYASTAWSEAAECLGAALNAAAGTEQPPEVIDDLRIRAAHAYDRDMDAELAGEIYQDLAASGRRYGNLQHWAIGTEGHMRLSTAYRQQAIRGTLAADPLIELLDQLEGQPRLRAPILRTWAELESTAGNTSEGTRLAAQAVAAAQLAGDRILYSNALFAAGYANLVGLNLDDAFEYFHECGPLRSQPGDEWLLSECLSRQAWALLLRGDLVAADEVATLAVEAAMTSRCWTSAALAEAAQAAGLLARGSLDEAATKAELAMVHASRASYPSAPLLIYPILASIHRARGDHSASRLLLGSWKQAGIPGDSIYRLLLDHDLRPTAVADTPRIPGTVNLGTLASVGGIVELAGVGGRSEQLPTIDAQLKRLDGVEFTTTGQLVLRLRGTLAAAAGDRSQAQELLHSGALRADELGALGEAARCRLTLAAVTDDPSVSAESAAIGRNMAHGMGFAPSFYSTTQRELEVDFDTEQTAELTVVFSDLVGSTHMSVTKGDRAYLWAVDQSREILRARCQDYRGVEFGTQGDGFLAFFRSAELAADYSLAVGFDVAEPIGHPDAPRIELKIGIATGRPILRDDSLYGTTVNLAARLSDISRPGLVTVDADTCRLASASHSIESRGVVELKGFPGLIPVFTLLGRR